ncbi:GNAT family N-acetyltransferase [Clostridium tarantellae]|uniref:GNAT family N-acetyltransferase n=1 Tax=Clostridium tarantellae TaxID=39493 RepID=A0A6I1MRM6_9CLOT|nr:N-acetyltransferase [Clostridium tarantellae]MPQ44847.1 GNAT family N-acetyltransferase [Clostridium tarantellae]
MNIKIRREEPKDYRKVEEVAREAFWNLYFPGASEHVAVNKLRKDKDFIPELTYVIEVDGEIIGAIFYSHSKVVSEDGTEHKTISFGPVFILPTMHRKGLGGKLITYSIKEAKKLGYKAITTLGYSYHYEPYGFLGGKKYGISMPDGKFYKGLLVLPLYEGALDNISGYAVFSNALEPSEDEIEKFDKTFPYKEKKVQESQREFEVASSMLDE